MESSSHSNASTLLNQSSIINSTSKTYIVSPLPLMIKITMTIIMALVGSGGLVANSLLLYIVRKQEKIRKKGRTVKCFTRILTPYFIQSLALSDFLCSLVNLPVFIAQLYSDIVQNEWGCRCVRYLNLFFAVVTLNNLLVIGIERYMALFYPFLLPSPKFSKNLVILAWIAGAVIVIVPIVTFKTEPIDLGVHEYTVICRYEKTVPVYRAMFIGFTVVNYVIPSIILTITNIQILIFLKSQKNASNSAEQIVANSWRFNDTKMFVSLIFAFVIPYCLYVIYSGLNIALKINLSFTVDYVVRRVSGIIAYSIALVSPTIIFSSMPSLRNMLRNLLRKVFCLKRNARVSEVNPAVLP
ncbi:melanopsin-like [Actinia tenebrosa]|uniref:Melanopsin-like n=1 Tax=Actinia tenebrosa TaxID=6105 RepID=A0A6P8I5E1_ACTTE|nr:melanopsin-like [Actinia tenebrosa]